MFSIKKVEKDIGREFETYREFGEFLREEEYLNFAMVRHPYER